MDAEQKKKLKDIGIIVATGVVGYEVIENTDIGNNHPVVGGALFAGATAWAILSDFKFNGLTVWAKNFLSPAKDDPALETYAQSENASIPYAEVVNDITTAKKLQNKLPAAKAALPRNTFMS